LSDDHRSETVASPCASFEIIAGIGLSPAERDLPDNLNVTGLAMDCLKIILVEYIFWRSGCEAFDWAIQFECHVAINSTSVLQKIRRAAQDCSDYWLSQPRPHVLVNADCQWVLFLCHGWLDRQQQTKAYNRNAALHICLLRCQLLRSKRACQCTR
jgi:hypothetical protein